MRIGLGFDVHAFAKDETLIIGGVNIKYNRGLKGHSDADVLTHALMDALLGAMGKGDIGQAFPDTDEQYKDISSLILLKRVYDQLKINFRINNIDLIIIAQNPKMSPYYNEMKQNYANILQLDEALVNLKSTTTERLGFTGRKEGIAAQAIVLLSEL